MTSLRFVGDWSPWLGLAIAVALAVLAWVFYWRGLRDQSGRWVLPSLRALAVFLIVTMLTGPVLHHRQTVGQLSRLWLFVDGSKSMGLKDPSMPVGRKLLIAAGRGWSDTVDLSLVQAAALIGDACGRVESGSPSDSAEPFAKALEEALTTLNRMPPEIRDEVFGKGWKTPLDRFRREVVEPAGKIARNQPERRGAELQRLLHRARAWEEQLNQRFSEWASGPAVANNPAIQAALTRFDSTTRWERMRAALGDDLLTKLASRHEIQAILLEEDSATEFWRSDHSAAGAPRFQQEPRGSKSNLTDPIRSTLGETRKGERGAVVLLSDGQQNAGGSPLELARLLAERGIPMFTVGFGSEVAPGDLAVANITAPESVFDKDRVRGLITLKDAMPAGQRFKLQVEHEGTTVWETELATEKSGLRRIPYDFPVEELVRAARERVEISAALLKFTVSIKGTQPDAEPSNDTDSFLVRAITEKRKLLLLDGRPRWEFRYLRNLFERDPQWEVNALLAEGDQAFPSSQELLDAHDLIVFGEVPRECLSKQQLEWLREFVNKRGGGLIFIDGRRGMLREFEHSPIAPLLPVEWKGDPRPASALRLTDRAALLPAFALESDPKANLKTWGSLKAPHFVAGVSALPGTETLVEADESPVMVLRTFGAGKVLYSATDETWRWRYEVADQHHQRFWNQVAGWIMETPYAVRGKQVSLDTGALIYKPGEIANIRVRLRDERGGALSGARADAEIQRDGRRIASIRLVAEEGGVYRGRTGALEAGSYEVRVHADGIAEDIRARFAVRDLGPNELARLELNAELLRRMASLSRGSYLPEENLPALATLLEPLSHGQVVETETALWQSYWWLCALVLLFSAEWILRKRKGLL